MTRRAALRITALRITAVVGLVTALAMIAACAPSTPNSGPSTIARTGVVAAEPSGLTLGGAPWWPAGFNAYQLGTDWDVNEGCGAEVDLEAYFEALPPRALTRVNFFAAFAADKNTGQLNFDPIDAIIEAAARHQQMLLPVLTGGHGACEGEQFKERDWYVDGWRSSVAAGGITYSQWLRAVVERYQSRQVISGWELVGEPEASVCTAQGCAWQVRVCPPGGAAVLRTFFDDAGAELRTIDDARPIFAGFIGGDQCGLAGADYAQVGASAGIDVLDYHHYREGPNGARDSTFGPAGSDLVTRIAQADALGKPIIVGEVGLNGGSCKSTEVRAAQVRDSLGEYRNAGVDGALLWAFVPDPRPAECTYDIGFDDPIWEVIADSVG